MKQFFAKSIAAAFIASCAIFSTSANAADLGSYKGGSMKDGYDYKSEAVWKGFYIGGHIGGSFGGEIDFYGIDTGLELDGFIGGIHAGYNFQHQNTVFGIEGDVSWSGAEDELSFGRRASLKVESTYLASLRARLGYAAGNTLFFVTGGVAWTELEAELNVGRFSLTGSETLTGYVVGGGLEHKFTQNLSGRVELLHYGFDDKNIEYDPTVVRAGLTWHLN